MKEYMKPEVEKVEFVVEEITTAEGEMGTGSFSGTGNPGLE